MMIAFTTIWYIMGLFVFYTAATFDSYENLPEWIYYWWAKLLDVLLFITVYNHVPTKWKAPLKPVIYFSIIRFVWDIISYITGLSVTNSIWVAFLFMVLTALLFWAFIKEWQKWLK